VRAFCRALFGLVLRIFFRRIEVSGLAHVPSDGPVIFVLNHPSGLIDPAFLLCLAPRRVAFLAKAPLFRMPVIAMVCRAFEAIPVHRRQDVGADPVANRATFETARAVLASGGAIALFPEGASHSEPKLRPLKTGAARIALGAAAGLTGPPIQIVPAGLYYRAKRTFRSAALLHFGEPFGVDPVPLTPGEEPPAGQVRELTARIERALAAVTLQAEHAEVLALAERAQRIVAARDEPPATPPSLAEEFAVRRRLLEGYRVARARWPERCAALAARIERYEAALATAGLDPRQLTLKGLGPGRVARYVGKAVFVLGLLLPAALVGLAVHYPAYRAVGFVATGIAKGAEDSLASIKVLAAMLLFPLTWMGVAAVVSLARTLGQGLVALALAPLAGYAALVFSERLDRIVGGGRALGLFVFRRWAYLRLVAERKDIQADILALGREIGAA
jgi:1-acyl-sn-glycerol-3-phosphate acyltransferase